MCMCMPYTLTLYIVHTLHCRPQLSTPQSPNLQLPNGSGGRIWSMREPMNILADKFLVQIVARQHTRTPMRYCASPSDDQMQLNAKEQRTTAWEHCLMRNSTTLTSHRRILFLVKSLWACTKYECMFPLACDMRHHVTNSPNHHATNANAKLLMLIHRPLSFFTHRQKFNHGRPNHLWDDTIKHMGIGQPPASL